VDNSVDPALVLGSGFRSGSRFACLCVPA